MRTRRQTGGHYYINCIYVCIYFLGSYTPFYACIIQFQLPQIYIVIIFFYFNIEIL